MSAYVSVRVAPISAIWTNQRGMSQAAVRANSISLSSQQVKRNLSQPRTTLRARLRSTAGNYIDVRTSAIKIEYMDGRFHTGLHGALSAYSGTSAAQSGFESQLSFACVGFHFLLLEAIWLALPHSKTLQKDYRPCELDWLFFYLLCAM